MQLTFILSGKATSIRETIFLAHLKVQRAVRDDRWKLITHPKVQHMQLFDLHNDPHETISLIDNAEHQSHAKRLLQRMHEWQKELNDKVDVSLTRVPTVPFDFSDQKRLPDQWQPEWIAKKYFYKPQ